MCVCVFKAEQLSSNESAAGARREDVTKPVTSSAAVNSPRDVTADSSVSAPSQLSDRGSTKPPQPAVARPPSTPCPYQVIEICNQCWTRSNLIIAKSPKAEQCSKVGHPWIGVSFLILPCKKLLAALPPTIPRNLNFAVCWDLAKQKRCRRGDCTFAHCEEEIAIWKWMVQNNGKLL